MRKLILLVVALLISAGVLAKNPSATAPSLAASFAGIPFARDVYRGADAPATDNAAPVASEDLNAETTPAVTEMPVADAPNVDVPTEPGEAPATAPLADPAITNGTADAISPEIGDADAATSLKESVEASTNHSRSLASPTKDNSLTLARNASVATDAAPISTTAFVADSYDLEISELERRTQLAMLLTPEASAAATLITLEEAGLATSLPTGNILKARLAEEDRIADTRQEANEPTPPNSVIELVDRSIAEAIDVVIPATPFHASKSPVASSVRDAVLYLPAGIADASATGLSTEAANLAIVAAPPTHRVAARKMPVAANSSVLDLAPESISNASHGSSTGLRAEYATAVPGVAPPTLNIPAVKPAPVGIRRSLSPVSSSVGSAWLAADLASVRTEGTGVIESAASSRNAIVLPPDLPAPKVRPAFVEPRRSVRPVRSSVSGAQPASFSGRVMNASTGLAAPPMFARVDIAPPPTLRIVGPAPKKVFTINIREDSSYAANRSPVFRADAMPATSKRPAAAAPNASFTLNLQDGSYCDPNFVGPTITFAQTAELTLDDFLYQIHNRFGVNFIMGANIGSMPVNIKAGSVPWNRLLKSMLFISGVRARCLDQNTIELVDNKALSGLQDMADVRTRFVKLKFLQRTSGGTVDLANRSQGGQGGQGGGCGGSSQGGQSGGSFGGQGGGQTGQTVSQQASSKFDKLIIEIEKILGIRSMTESSVGGGQGGQGGAVLQQTEVRRTNRFVTQIPGRNILAISATEEEHALIDAIIVRADRPPFQVVIKGLVYSANQDRLRDLGIQTTITEDAGRTSGGIFGPSLGVGERFFDFSAIIGTFDFNVQATAFQQNGVISVKSRPFATVIDGLCTTLDVGRELPIVINSTLGGQGDVIFVNAANRLAVTPYVIDDDNGNPMAVTLELNLAANDIDSSVTALGVPAISQRSIQTQLMLGEDKTAILGGFTVDQDSRTVSKTPGLGDIPIIGELFKRRVRDTRLNRLYFAISVSVIPYGEVIRPVDVPGATTDPPSITPEMKVRSDKAEPKQVVGPGYTGP